MRVVSACELKTAIDDLQSRFGTRVLQSSGVKEARSVTESPQGGVCAYNEEVRAEKDSQH